VCNF
jgi:hypothetical protein